jgi:hypothetical protein
MTKGTEILWSIEDRKGIDGRALDPHRIEVLEDMLHSLFGAKVIIQSLTQLPSKKNIVLHLVLHDTKSGNVSIVAKLFVAESFEIERDALLLACEKKLKVPSVLAVQNGVILMDHVDGVPLVDVINDRFDLSPVDTLAQWYYSFHRETGHVKGDPRLRNFLYSNGTIYGIDFEEYRYAHWMEDIGGIAASFLDTRPVFDVRKRRLSWHLLEKYLSLTDEARSKDIDTYFTETIAVTLEKTAQWRDDRQILKLSERVRQHGLPAD